MRSFSRRGISRLVLVVVIIVIIVAAGAGAYYFSTIKPSSTGGTNSSAPNSITYETLYNFKILDPDISGRLTEFIPMFNMYEPLIWYNGSNAADLIPWLAQSYTASSDLSTYNFTLRQGIKFADGEPFNASAVYFTFNRFLMYDGSTPTSHGTQEGVQIQKYLNSSLSWALSGPHPYNSNYVNEVLAQNFVTINGPYSISLHVMHPSLAFIYEIAETYMTILAPTYVMQHDVGVWNQTSTTQYSLPYPKLSGNLTQQMDQYYDDLVSTCNSGVTPSGCGQSYLYSSSAGSLAGTGPYTLTSFDFASQTITLQANSNYWGGPSGNIHPTIKTAYLKDVPDTTTREIDLENAAKSGQAMIIEETPDQLYTFANKNAWLTNHTLVPSIPGTQVQGPFNANQVWYYQFAENVTNPYTGDYYTFQPFADIRFRTAFADTVNVTLEVQNVGNGLGTTATSFMPPGLAPDGSYSSTIKPAYSYNLDQAQALLLAAMENPVTQFNFKNGTAAPAGFFNNSFGCTTLNSKNKCSSPIPQTITITYDQGDTIDEAISNQMAGAINNISTTYNMGLTVTTAALPTGVVESEGYADSLQVWQLAHSASSPWAVDYAEANYGPGNPTIGNGWNYSVINQLYNQAVFDSQHNNSTGVASTLVQLEQVSNSLVLDMYTYDAETFVPMTSNIHGFFFNYALLYSYYFAGMTLT